MGYFVTWNISLKIRESKGKRLSSLSTEKDILHLSPSWFYNFIWLDIIPPSPSLENCIITQHITRGIMIHSFGEIKHKHTQKNSNKGKMFHFFVAEFPALIIWHFALFDVNICFESGKRSNYHWIHRRELWDSYIGQ